MPLVTVGIPAYNAAKSLTRALDSLLAQSFKDFEVIIGDNASTDDTIDICNRYASRDQRIRFHRHGSNIGVAGNWNFVARAGRGRYFKWASATDWCSPLFLERCVAELERDSGLALCFTRTEFVDGDGQSLGVCEADFEVLAPEPSRRFAQVATRLTVNNVQNGLIRTSALAKTRLERNYPGGDMVLMAELALHGRYRMLPETLLFRRADRESWTQLRSALERERLYAPSATRARKLLRTRMQLDYVYSAICASSLPAVERLRAAAFALRHSYWVSAEIIDELRTILKLRGRIGGAS